MRVPHLFPERQSSQLGLSGNYCKTEARAPYCWAPNWAGWLMGSPTAPCCTWDLCSPTASKARWSKKPPLPCSDQQGTLPLTNLCIRLATDLGDLSSNYRYFAQLQGLQIYTLKYRELKQLNNSKVNNLLLRSFPQTEQWLYPIFVPFVLFLRKELILIICWFEMKCNLHIKLGLF